MQAFLIVESGDNAVLGVRSQRVRQHLRCSRMMSASSVEVRMAVKFGWLDHELVWARYAEGLGPAQIGRIMR